MTSDKGFLISKLLFFQELLAHVSISLEPLLMPENDAFQGVERSFGCSAGFLGLEKLFLTLFQISFWPLGQWICARGAIIYIALVHHSDNLQFDVL